MLFVLSIRLLLTSYNSGDASLGDSEAINHVVKLLQSNVLGHVVFYCTYFDICKS